MLTVIASSTRSFNLSAGNLFWSIVFMCGGLAGLYARYRRGQQEARKRQRADQSLNARLERLATSIRESARLAEEVSAEVDLRAAAVRELEAKAREAEALAALNKDQAEAVQRLVDASFVTAGKRQRRDSIWMNAATFVLGAGVTLLVTVFVH